MRVRTACCVVALSLLLPLAAEGQGTGQITGVVTSDLGQPLSGVQVTVRGDARLTATTSENGRYLILNVPAGRHVVETSLLGFGVQELPVTVTAGTPSILDIRLQTRAIALDQVVVVGYGTQRREAVTGAVASVQAADFNQGPARDAAALIAGKMPGLAVIQPSGDPRATAQIQLRGRTTIQGPTNPLILIDGVPGGLQTVAAEDIESISVLKDGSAAAMYGSRASNGVILITTKRHQGGAPTLRYDGYLSQSRIFNAPDFLTAGDYRRLIGEGHAFEDLGFATDWQAEMTRQPVNYRHNLLLTGGALNTNYTASLNVENENGIFRRSDNREVTARANIRHAMFDGRLEAEANLLSRTQNYFTGPSFDYAWRQTLIRNPTDRVTDDEAGLWQERTGYFYVNPVALVEEHNGEVENRTTRMHGTLTLRPMQGLRFSLMGGTSEANGLSGNATTFRHSSNTQGNSGGTAGRGTSSDRDRILETTGTYTNRFGQHNVTVLAGYSYQDFLDESFSASNSRFPTDLFGWDQLQRGTALGEGIASMSSNKSDYKVIGFFGRLNYDWQNRYLFMASLRHEGNSRFGADHKWGLFPRSPPAGASARRASCRACPSMTCGFASAMA
jgi:TonB-dependent starch-binding outer membrane protein SusC